MRTSRKVMWLSIFLTFLASCLRFALSDNTSTFDVQYQSFHVDLQLVTDVQRYYRVQTLFVVYDRADGDMQVTSTLMGMLRRFSDKDVHSTTITYGELQLYGKYYHYRIRKPLYVVFVNDTKHMEQFQRATSHYHVSYPVWLLICSRFVPNEICDRPKINYFNVNFNTRMMVKCHGDPMIKEWYSIDGVNVNIQDYAYWSLSKGLQVIHKSPGLYNRRYNLEGKVLKIATLKEWSFTSDKKALLNKGFFAAIIHELKLFLNFSINLAYQEDTYGSRDKKTGKYHGVIGRLQSREVDVGVGEFTMTGPRLDVVDFTIPILVSKNYLYVRKPDKSILLWFAHFKVYTIFVWITFQAMFYLSLVIVTIVQVALKDEPIPSNYISENILSLWGIYCQQCLPVFPTAMPSRIAYFSSIATSLIIWTVYSACLFNYIAWTPPIVLFNDFTEFTRDGTYQIVTIYNSSYYDLFMTTNDSLLKDMSRLMPSQEYLPKTVIAGFKQVCSRKIAFYVTEAQKSSVSARIPCELVRIALGTIGCLGLSLTKHSQYKGLVDFALKKFHDHGIMSRIRSRIYKKDELPKNQFIPFPFTGVVSILLIFGAGVLLSLVIFAIEIIVYRRNISRQDQKCGSVAAKISTILVDGPR